MIAPVKVSATDNGIRLHRWVMRHYPNANMILVRRLCRGGEIRINSKRAKVGDILNTGDMLRIPPEIADSKTRPNPAAAKSGFSLADLEKLRKTIIHSDDDIVVFDKPAGLATQGGSGIRKSLDKMAAALFPNDLPMLVHRLDKETSGVLLVAKTRLAAQKLARAFQSKDVHKEYLALLAGGVSPKKGIVSEPVDGKKAVTRYHVLGELKDTLSFVRFLPETGRKHQLRLHSAGVLGAPIVGDALYGGRRLGGKLAALLSLDHLYLFASKIVFRHPRTGKLLAVSAPMPEWMASVANLLEIEL